MSGMHPTIERAPRLHWHVARSRRRVRLLAVLRVMGSCCAAIALALTLIVVLDAIRPLPAIARLGGLVLLAVGLLVGLVLSVVRARGIRPEALIDASERAWGVERGVLRNGWSFAEEPPTDGVALRLAERVWARAERVVEQHERTPVLSRAHGAGGRWGVAVLVLVGAIGAVVGGSRHVEIGLLRVLDPLGDHPPAMPTEVTLRLASERVLIGDDALLEVVCSGQPVDRAWLEVSGRDGERVRVELAPDDEEGVRWRGALRALRTPVRVRAHTPTGYSKRLVVDPQALARIVAQRVFVLAPEHASAYAPEMIWDEGDAVRAVEGASLRVEWTASMPVIGVRDRSGALVGEAAGTRVRLTRAVGPLGSERRWSFTPVSEAGDGPEAWEVTVTTLADRAPALVLRLDAPTVLPDGGVTVLASARDDVALDPASFEMHARIGDGAWAELPHDARWADHASVRSRARVRPDVLGAEVGSTITLRVRARDTYPAREAAEATVAVRVIGPEEARAAALGALTIDGLARPLEEAAEALERRADGTRRARERAQRALERIAAHEGHTGFERAAQERAEGLLGRLDEEETIWEARTALRAPAERLRLADAMREVAEALGRLTERQRALADGLGEGEIGWAEGASEQGALRARLAFLSERLDALGGEGLTPPMDGERLGTLRQELAEAIGQLEEAVGTAIDEGAATDELRALRDLVHADLHLGSRALLDQGTGAAALRSSAAQTIVVLEAILETGAVREGWMASMRVCETLVRAIEHEATPPLPLMGASALLIGQRLDEMGVLDVMRRAASALGGEDERAVGLVSEAAEMLESLVRDRQAHEPAEGEGRTDAPLSLAVASAGAAESSAGSDGGSEPADALEQLSINRAAREEAGGEEMGAESSSDAGGEEAAVAGAGAGDGASGTTAGGRRAPPGATDTGDEDALATPGRSVGGFVGAGEETLALTPGEAERLARVPERYRALVAAYLRSLRDASEGERTGRIER